MIRFIIIVFFYLASFTLLCQNKNTDVIVWSGVTRLTWNEYTKITPKKDLPGQAATTLAFSIRDTCINGQLRWKIISVMSKSMSWVFKTKIDDKYLLEHEQLHFDLLEVYARMCRRDIASMENTCSHKSEDKIAERIDEYKKLQLKENLKFDEETNHSKNKLKQKEWSDRIKQQLEELKAYK